MARLVHRVAGTLHRRVDRNFGVPSSMLSEMLTDVAQTLPGVGGGAQLCSRRLNNWAAAYGLVSYLLGIQLLHASLVAYYRRLAQQGSLDTFASSRMAGLRFMLCGVRNSFQ